MSTLSVPESPTAAAEVAQYDPVAEDYDRLIRPKYEPIAALVRDRVLELVDPGDADVVELSAGTGALTHQLAPLSGRYLATDISERMMQIGRARTTTASAHVTWMRADVECMVLDTGSADLVVSALGPFQDTDGGTAEARRLLRPGGRLVGCTWGDSYRELDLLQAARASLDLPPRPVSTAQQLSRRLELAGFEHIEIRDARLSVTHDSVEAYLCYRQAFGQLPTIGTLSTERVLEALATCASRYLDDRGRVILDWHLLVMSARV